MSLKKDFLEKGLELKENENLARYAYMKVGGRAKFFLVVKKVDDLIESVKLATEAGLKYRVIGAASNIVISDDGFEGLIIKNQTSDLVFKKSGEIEVASGLGLARFIMQTGRNGWGGLENLYGIPGTVGGAIYGNAGAHGVDISDYLVSIRLLTKEGKIVVKPKDWLDFDYRSSKLKRAKSSQVILDAKFAFKKIEPAESLKKIQEHNRWRIGHQPVGQPCCGSVFKNPSHGHSQRRNSNSAGSLLDKAGVKDMAVGSAHPSELHANFVVHDGNASSAEIRILFNRMRRAVLDKFGVKLVEEIEYLGKWDYESEVAQKV